VGRPIVLVWDNFGFMHDDRCEALAKHYAGRRRVIGIEITSKSDTYNWTSEPVSGFQKITLHYGKAIDEIAFFARVSSTLSACLRQGYADVFLCHYSDFAMFMVAVMLRVLGRRVYVMNNSKFDDKKRFLLKEAIKASFFWPYCGALVAGARSAEYLQFLSISPIHIVSGYNSLSIDRVRAAAGAPPAPQGAPFAERHFTIVARYVPKKNLFLALEAYSLYRSQVDAPHELHLAGYGPLEGELRRRAKDLRLEKLVVFRGSISNRAVCALLAKTSVLILPSVEEQFGNVVIEAQAMGLPVIVSENCGCLDHLVRSGVNGFVVEPDNSIGLACFMKVLSSNPLIWRKMCLEAQNFAGMGDVAVFAKGVAALLEGRDILPL
jgi:glycosyltransferase involved in cell wall biosynthesis